MRCSKYDPSLAGPGQIKPSKNPDSLLILSYMPLIKIEVKCNTWASGEILFENIKLVNENKS